MDDRVRTQSTAPEREVGQGIDLGNHSRVVLALLEGVTEVLDEEGQALTLPEVVLHRQEAHGHEPVAVADLL